MSEQRKYRNFSVQKKLEIVLVGLRGDVSVKELCRQHQIAETLYCSWREKLLEGGKVALAGKEERQGERALKQRIRELERTLGRKTYELEVAGEHCGAGSEGARVRVPRAGRERPTPGRCRARAPGQPHRLVQDAEAASVESTPSRC